MFEQIFKDKIHGSLDIGSKNIRGLSLKGNKIEKILKRTIAHTVDSEERDTRDFEYTLSNIIEELKLKKKNIIISIPGQEFYTKSVIIEKEEDDVKRNEKIREELIEMIPNFDPLDFLIESIVIRTTENEQELITISIEREKVEEYQKLLEKQNVTILKIVPDYISCVNLIEQKRNHDLDVEFKGVTGIIDVGYGGTKVYFVDDEGLQMYVSTIVGGNEFTETIKEHKQISYEEAEIIKNKIEISEELESREEEEELFLELTNVYNELERNITSSIDYFRSKNPTLMLKKITLIGEASLLNGFLKRVSDDQKIEVEYIDYEELGIDLNLGEMNPVEVASLIGNIIGEVV